MRDGMRGSDRQAAQRRHPAPPRFFCAFRCCVVALFGARACLRRPRAQRAGDEATLPPRQRSRRTCIKTFTYLYGHFFWGS